MRAEGLDSIITNNNCGEDFLHLLATQNLGRTHQWSASGNADTKISLKALHLNALSLQAYYRYNNLSGYDKQHYQLQTANATADKRNRYDKQPEHNYFYRIIASYPIIDISRIRKICYLYFTNIYTQEYNTSERMYFRLDNLGEQWAPDQAPIGLLPSASNLYDHCIDSLNSYNRTSILRNNTTELRWYYHTENLHIQAQLPLNITYEHLNEWRPKTKQTHTRKETYLNPQITFKTKGIELRFEMQHKLPPQTLMLDNSNTTNPLTIFLGNPSLKCSNEYYITTGWSGFQQEKMRQWNIKLILQTIDNAIGQLRQFNPQTGGYTYTPCNINGNRGLWATANHSQSLGKEKQWYLNIGTDIKLNRSVDFANTDETDDYHKSIVHNLHISPNIGIDYRHTKWHASFKASADWERLTSAQDGFKTLSQIDYLNTLSLKAPLPLEIDLNTDLNLFMRRGYGDRAMNTNEWVWNANLIRSINKSKTWIAKLSIHDLLGQLSPVRRTLNAQGRIETRSNTLTRNIMLHLIWKFNKKPSKG